MRILIDTTLLCDSDASVGQVGPGGLTLNGQSIVDEVAFFRAVALSYFDRGVESVDLQFRVQRSFDSHRLAQKFVFTHRNAVPRQGRLECIVGEGADVESIYLEDCIVQPSIASLEGVAVVVAYAIRGGQFSTDVPEPLPSADPAEDEVSFRRGKVSIASAATSVAVTFSAPLASAPTAITPLVSHASGEDAVDCELLEDTITSSGFSVKLSAATPSANYKLHYTAFL